MSAIEFKGELLYLATDMKKKKKPTTATVTIRVSLDDARRLAELLYAKDSTFTAKLAETAGEET